MLNTQLNPIMQGILNNFATARIPAQTLQTLNPDGAVDCAERANRVLGVDSRRCKGCWNSGTKACDTCTAKDSGRILAELARNGETLVVAKIADAGREAKLKAAQMIIKLKQAADKRRATNKAKKEGAK